MRIFLLRVILAWWLIPVMFVLGMPIWCLLGEPEEAWGCMKTFAYEIWNGEYL